MAKKKSIPEMSSNETSKLENQTAEATQPNPSDNSNDGSDSGNYDFGNTTFGDIVEKEESAEENARPPKIEEKEFDLDAIMKEYGAEVAPEKRKRKPRQPKATEPTKVQFIIPGRLFVTVCDNALTSGIGALDSWISKNPINTDMLKLSDQQIADLSPLAEEAIKAMKLENDPITVFFGSLAAIYISNYTMLRAAINKMQKDNAKRN